MTKKITHQGIKFGLEKWGKNTILILCLSLSGIAQTLPPEQASSAGEIKQSVINKGIINLLPKVMITSPRENAIYHSGDEILIKADAVDFDGSIQKVTFHQGKTLLGEDTSAPYSFSWKNAPGGDYQLTAQAIDTQGGITTSNIVTIKTTANLLPVIILRAPVNNESFGIGSTITLKAEASDPDGQVVEVSFYQGNSLLGKSSSSPYQFIWQNVPAGNYRLTAKATDQKGAESISAPIDIIVEMVQTPEVKIVTPISGAVFATGSDIEIEANVFASSVRVAKVVFYEGNTILGEVLTTPYRFVWKKVTSGSYRLTAKIIDDRGIEANSSPVDIAVKTSNEPPIVVITQPTQGQLFATGDKIIMETNASDPDGQVTKVVYYNGMLLLGEGSGALYYFEWNNVPAGQYHLTAKAVDNKGAEKVSAAVNIQVNALPVVSITAPVTGNVFTAGNNITIKVNASDPDGQIAEVAFFQENIFLGKDNTAPYSFEWMNVPEGTCHLNAKAVDNNGAETISTAAFITVKGLNEPPVVRITRPSSGKVFSAGKDILIKAEASDPDGKVKEVAFYAGSKLLHKTPPPGDPYRYQWTNVPGGRHRLTVRATDNKGTTKSSTEVEVIVNESPTVKITAPADGSTFMQGDTIRGNIDARDPDGQIVEVVLYNGGIYQLTMKNPPYRFWWPGNASPGNHSLSAEAKDDFGAVVRSARINFYVESASESAKNNTQRNQLQQLPNNFQLSQNYPNPFNPHTRIAYKLPENARVRLEIYDIAGQKVRTLVNQFQERGNHTVNWDALDESGRKVASGVYIYRIQTIGQHLTFTNNKKMLLMK